MTQDQRPYYDNPYLTSSTGGREKMNFVRSTLMICATLLLSIAVYIFYNYYQNRYFIVAQDAGVYIFDRQDSQVHFCNQDNCKAVTPQYTLQAMIQALPQTGLGGGKAITLPPSIHSALGDKGNPMALAQALLAQSNAKKEAVKPEIDLDDRGSSFSSYQPQDRDDRGYSEPASYDSAADYSQDYDQPSTFESGVTEFDFGAQPDEGFEGTADFTGTAGGFEGSDLDDQQELESDEDFIDGP